MHEFHAPPIEAVRALLRAMPGRRVAVVGDAMLDAYLMGRVKRISPEAPVPVFEIQKEERLLGGAANVAKALVALGAKVKLCAVVGRDEPGALFRREARGLGIGLGGVLADPARPTTVKSRVVARQQQMLRLDREACSALSEKLEARLIQHVQEAVSWADAVVLSDYGKGVLTERVCRAALRAASGKPLAVDPKDLPWARYRGATILKPNAAAAGRFTGEAVHDDASAERAARKIIAKLNLGHALVTRGRQGMTLAEGAGQNKKRKGKGAKRIRVRHLPSRPREVYDVTGAGDVVAAGLSLALAAGAEISLATYLANAAAGVKVGKFGPATVSEQEILEALGGGDPSCERKVMTRREAAALAARWRKRGKKVVFTNGCFDILHYGHVAFLERSRKLGDALIVGLNSDASVRRLKGPGRPVQPAHDRLRIIAAQGCVDAVVPFGEDTPKALIKAVRPDVLCKGADYRHKRNVVGWEWVERHGGRVVLVELVANRSTSKLINR